MAGAIRAWDAHCHLASIVGRTPTERMANLVRYANRMNIERVCVSMGMTFVQNPTPDNLRQQNDEVLEAINHYHDRAFGFCYVSGEHVEASLSEMDRCIANGSMVGLKLWVAKRASDSSLDRIVTRATELKAIILQHTWIKSDGSQLPGESTPMDLAELARRHPDATFLCGHAGGIWEYGIRAVRSLPNVVVETAGGDPTVGLVEMAVRELGEQRVVFGSDAPGRSFGSQLSKITGADIRVEAKTRILRGNLQRILAPILGRKGIAT